MALSEYQLMDLQRFCHYSKNINDLIKMIEKDSTKYTKLSWEDDNLKNYRWIICSTFDIMRMSEDCINKLKRMNPTLKSCIEKKEYRTFMMNQTVIHPLFMEVCEKKAANKMTHAEGEKIINRDEERILDCLTLKQFKDKYQNK